MLMSNLGTIIPLDRKHEEVNSNFIFLLRRQQPTVSQDESALVSIIQRNQSLFAQMMYQQNALMSTQVRGLPSINESYNTAIPNNPDIQEPTDEITGSEEKSK